MTSKTVQQVVTGLAILLWVAAWCASAQGQAAPAAGAQPAAPPGGKQVAVLDAGCVWRIYGVMKPPVIEPNGGGAPRPFLASQPWLNWESPEPSAGWMKPDFDDRAWLRSPASAPLATPYLSRLCMRAEFTVSDLAKASPMSLELCYQGGAAVYVNGQEVARGNLPAGELPATALAEGYAREAYVTDKDELVPGGWMASNFPKQVALRKRWLKGIAVPPKFLRAGTNMLAVEIIRAPYNQVIEEKRFSGKQAGEAKARGCPYQITWGTCQFQDLQMTSAGGEGVVAKAAPRAGFQVRSSDILDPSDRESDLTAQPDVLGPISIVAARNGAFSGKAIVGSAQAIRGLKATCGELKLVGGPASDFAKASPDKSQGSAAAGGTIPASAVQVRYGVAWGSDMDKAPKPPGLDILLENPPKEISPGKNGALAAVWVTVHVPANATAGEYTGQLTVEADGSTTSSPPSGGKPVSVPIVVKVADFALPNTQDYRTWIDMIQSPDSLAIEANVPLWSDRHWELIAKSMDLMGQAGCRIVYVPLMVHTNLGNEQSMVRWVKKDGGSTGLAASKYEYDYSIMDKYLDTAEKHMGKPKMVVFQAWEIYLTDQVEAIPEADGENGWQTYLRNQRLARKALRGKGPGVTVFDPSTGKTDIEYVGPYADPNNKALWRPIFDELHKKLAKRGYENAMMVGLSSDMMPGKVDVAFLKDVSGDLPWVTQSHGGSGTGIKAPNVQYSSNGLDGAGRVGYATNVWDLKFNNNPFKDHMYGWKLPYLIAQHDRFAYFNTFPPTTLCCESEFNITGLQHGIGRIGADYWHVIRDKRGQRVALVPARYVESQWHNLDLGAAILATDGEGPVSSIRFEALREGVQDCEARIFIEQALTDPALKTKLGPELAQRVQDTLDLRLQYNWTGTSGLQLCGIQVEYATDPGADGAWRSHPGTVGATWFLSSGWQGREEKLFAAAGDVAKKLEGK